MTLEQEREAGVERTGGPQVAVIVLETRPEGGLRVTSPTHRNLHLSHSKADAVMADILPALREMGFAPFSPGPPPPSPPPPPR